MGCPLVVLGTGGVRSHGFAGPAVIDQEFVRRILVALRSRSCRGWALLAPKLARSPAPRVELVLRSANIPPCLEPPAVRVGDVFRWFGDSEALQDPSQNSIPAGHYLVIFVESRAAPAGLVQTAITSPSNAVVVATAAAAPCVGASAVVSVFSILVGLALDDLELYVVPRQRAECARLSEFMVAARSTCDGQCLCPSGRFIGLQMAFIGL